MAVRDKKGNVVEGDKVKKNSWPMPVKLGKIRISNRVVVLEIVNVEIIQRDVTWTIII
jgi:hypothetical protein